MKVRDIIQAIEDDGWRLRNQEGSHRQFVHPSKPGRVTVAGQPGKDVPPKTLADIYRQAKIEKSRR